MIRVSPLLVTGLVFTAVLVAAGLLAFNEFRDRNRTEEDEIRDTAEAFLDACIDEDFEEVWSLFSTDMREQVAVQRKRHREDLDDQEFFVKKAKIHRAEVGTEPPENLSAWYPWALPPKTLQGLTIRETRLLADGPETVVLLRPDTGRAPGGQRWCLELGVIREEGEWRIHIIAFQFSEELPVPPLPPRAKTGQTRDGRACLTLGVVPGARASSVAGHVAAADVAPADLVLVFRVDRDERFRVLTPWLVAGARAGVAEIRIRTERRTVGICGTTAWIYGTECSALSMGEGGLLEMAFSIPVRATVPDLLLEFGRDPRPPLDRRGREGMFLRSFLSHREGRPLSRIPKLLNRSAEELDIVLAPAGDASLRRVVYVGQSLEGPGYRLRPRLAVPAPDVSALASSMLYNGLTPAEVADESRTEFPPVAADHPALERVLVRPE